MQNFKKESLFLIRGNIFFFFKSVNDIEIPFIKYETIQTWKLQIEISYLEQTNISRMLAAEGYRLQNGDKLPDSFREKDTWLGLSLIFQYLNASLGLNLKTNFLAKIDA